MSVADTAFPAGVAIVAALVLDQLGLVAAALVADAAARRLGIAPVRQAALLAAAISAFQHRAARSTDTALAPIRPQSWQT